MTDISIHDEGNDAYTSLFIMRIVKAHLFLFILFTLNGAVFHLANDWRRLLSFRPTHRPFLHLLPFVTSAKNGIRQQGRNVSGTEDYLTWIQGRSKVRKGLRINTMRKRKLKPGNIILDYWRGRFNRVFSWSSSSKNRKKFSNAPSVQLDYEDYDDEPGYEVDVGSSDAHNEYDSCTDRDSGLLGICVTGRLCSRVGGRRSRGICGQAERRFVCCINTVVKCGNQVTLNNTYWQSSHTVGSSTSCGLTVTLGENQRYKEQPKPICQVRLDFITFSIAQPNSETVCNVDTFQVAGAANKVPIICGDNHGQHLYLTAPSSTADLQLTFYFGQSVADRSWNLLVSLIPCSASYLAPQDCLQYYTSASGVIRSFNWKDIAGTATRQLANQDYKICFRSELLESRQPAATLCLTPCTVFAAPNAFSISLANTSPEGSPSSSSPGASQASLGNCNNDYLIIPGGYNPTVETISPLNSLDRYCGERLNPLFGSATSVTVCTQFKTFNVYYKTNADETSTSTVDGPVSSPVANGNLGFCLNFQQKTA